MTDSLFDLTGKFALITGGTKGIGRGIADAFADYGASFAITGRKLEDAQAAAAEINARVGREAVIGLSAEIADRASLIAAHDAAEAHFGRIDVLVCNAAVVPTHYGSVFDWALDEYSALMEANVVNNAALMMHAAIPMKARRDGVIIATSSSGGIWPSYGGIPYSVSKAGLNFWVRGLAAEIAPYNVRVNAVAPGLTRSWNMVQEEKKNPEAMKMYESRVPLRRIIETREIAAAAVMLASVAGLGTTGQVIAVAGGEPGNGADPRA